MNEEDAIRIIVEWILKDRPGRLSHYGYDLYIPSLIQEYIEMTHKGLDQTQVTRRRDELFPIFADAAWTLCRRGVLRPGVRYHLAQSTEQGNAGSGFTITPFGLNWIRDTEHHLFVPTEPGRFTQMLDPFRDRFGPGFHQRAQEAVCCYGANIYLACCAMCGAAAESILLATAIALKKDETAVLEAYASARGRSRVEKMIIERVVDPLKVEFVIHTRLINYWRDESAHGKLSKISENEAFTSLALLLRFALFVDANWESLTHG